MVVALTNRPELPSRRAQVQAAEVGVRREKARPLLPLVILSGFQVPGNQSFQGGIFGLGPNSSLNQFVGREDVSIQAVWQLEGFGVGNLARIKAQRGQESRSLVDLRRAQDMVVADVTRARARVQSAAARVLQADRALRTGIVSFNGQLEGLGQTRRFGDVLVLTYRPQEVIYSLDLLSLAFQEYFTTVADYNRAQFELFPRPRLPGPGAGGSPSARRGPAGGHVASGLPAAGRQWASSGHPLSLDDPSSSFPKGGSIPMIARICGGGRPPSMAVALALMASLLAGPSAFGSDEQSLLSAGKKAQEPRKGLFGRHHASSGMLGSRPPGVKPGTRGFGLGYHPGYGYGGAAPGVGAEGGYPSYGGPGYPHPAPCLRRLGPETPFTYQGGSAPRPAQLLWRGRPPVRRPAGRHLRE